MVYFPRNSRIGQWLLAEMAKPQPRPSVKERRQRRERAQGPGWTEQEWLDLVAVHGGKCLACSSTERLVPDHVTPLIRGGAHAISNIQPLCSPCNIRKGITIKDYRTPVNKTIIPVFTK